MLGIRNSIGLLKEQGYLFFPGLLDNDEVAVLQQAMPDILNRQGPEVISEKEDPSVGLAGLKSCSHRPHRIHRKVSQKEETAVLQMRKERKL